MISNIRRKTTISYAQLAELSFILYFSMPLLKSLIKPISSDLAIYITYIPILLLLCLDRKRRCWRDTICLMFAVCLFFLITYFIHPEYDYYYTRNYYGVWDYVFRPDNGLYAFLFIRLIDDPDKILKYLRISAWLMFIYFGIEYVGFLNRGYWLSAWNGVIRHSSYNLEFGYDLLPYELVFLYAALKHKRWIDWIMAAAGSVMLLTGASRGPLLSIMIFLAAYFYVMIQRSKKKILIIGGLGIAAVFLYIGFIPIMNAVSRLLTSVGLSSRFIKMMIAGTASDDNGRMLIWMRAVQAIKNNPLGYGAMGSRALIYDIIHVGHPHNVFLEILIDYGVFAGAGIIIYGFVKIIRMLKMENIGEWKGLLIIYIGTSSQLLMSGTYWHRPGTWVLLAIGISVFYYRKKERANNG